MQVTRIQVYFNNLINFFLLNKGRIAFANNVGITRTLFNTLEKPNFKLCINCESERNC